MGPGYRKRSSALVAGAEPAQWPQGSRYACFVVEWVLFCFCMGVWWYSGGMDSSGMLSYSPLEGTGH